MDVESAGRPFEPDETHQGFAKVRWPLCPSPQHAEQAVEPLHLVHEEPCHHVQVIAADSRPSIDGIAFDLLATQLPKAVPSSPSHHRRSPSTLSLRLNPQGSC